MKPAKNQNLKAYSYIRFSTPEQKEGDSERRQIEAAEAYAKEHGLKLDSSMKDRGLSAYSGKHRTQGNLGQFLQLIKQGKIPKGSMLIIENMDRLSREKPDNVLDLFLSIIRSGITLVTLSDKRKFTNDSINENMGDLYIVIGEIYRAHKESERKSELLSEAWQEKRKRALNGIPLTRTCPQWMEPVEDGDGNLTGFEPIQEVAEVIQEMFRMKAEGIGAARIRNELNKRDDLWKPENGWPKCTINRYIRSKSVLGQFELHRRDEDNKRVSTGEIIEGYYPQIIDTDLWYRVKKVFDDNAKREGNAGGRNRTENNLFRHIDVLCKACGDGKMMYDDHGRYVYLRCKNHHRNNGCSESRSVNYRFFEPLLLRYCHGLDVTEIMPSNTKRQKELQNLRSDLQSIQGKLTELDQAIENRDTAINTAENKDMIAFHNEKLTELIRSKSEMTETRESIQSRITELTISKKETAERLQNIQQLIDRLVDVEGGERISLRIALRAKLQRLIERIDVGFGELREYGQPYTTFTIQHTDGVRRTLVLVDDKLDEVLTIEGDTVDVQDIARERQRTSNTKVAKAFNLSFSKPY